MGRSLPGAAASIRVMTRSHEEVELIRVVIFWQPLAQRCTLRASGQACDYIQHPSINNTEAQKMPRLYHEFNDEKTTSCLGVSSLMLIQQG